MVEVQDGQEVGRQQVELKETAPNLRALEVGKLNLSVLICGAVSQPLENMLLSLGIHVFSHLCGETEEILQAFVSGQLNRQSFLMPGCRGRRGQLRGRCGRFRGRHGRRW